MFCFPKHGYFLLVSSKGQGNIFESCKHQTKCVENFALSHRFPACWKFKFYPANTLSNTAYYAHGHQHPKSHMLSCFLLYCKHDIVSFQALKTSYQFFGHGYITHNDHQQQYDLKLHMLPLHQPKQSDCTYISHCFSIPANAPGHHQCKTHKKQENDDRAHYTSCYDRSGYVHLYWSEVTSSGT